MLAHENRSREKVGGKSLFFIQAICKIKQILNMCNREKHRRYKRNVHYDNTANEDIYGPTYYDCVLLWLPLLVNKVIFGWNGEDLNDQLFFMSNQYSLHKFY